MSEVEKINEFLKEMKERTVTKDEWVVALLSSIAVSLATIADNTNKAESED